MHNSLDVVCVPGWSDSAALQAIAWARRAGKRVVVMSDSQAVDFPRTWWREAIKSRLVRACDAALVAGRLHRDYVASLGMPADRVFLGYDAVDNAHFERGAAEARAEGATARARLGLPGRYLLASARFIPKKNLPRMIEAYAAARAGLADPPDLVLLGDGPERPAVEAAIARTGTGSCVHLPGFRSYDLLPAFYGLADGFVHVSTSEQWGLVVNEAAAAGLPLVVSRPCGATSELVRDGENGFVVDPDSVDDIAHALRRLMGLPPEARAAMGEASRRIVADWGPERFASGLMAACEAARAQPARDLMPWDAALIAMLSRRTQGRGVTTDFGGSVALVIMSLSRAAGGVVVPVRAIAERARARGGRAHAYGLSDSALAEDAPLWGNTPIAAVEPMLSRPFALAPALDRALRASDHDLLHLHGLWDYPSIAVSNWRARTGRPVMISPHGMLDPWALRNSAWKKKLALALYERRNLEGAACLHALTESEAASIRALGLSNPVALIPNGVDLPPPDSSRPRPAVLGNDDRAVMLFLGRLHPKKGLRETLLAWARLKHRAPATAARWRL
ncbi:MAG: glycosyltransferase, partial [Methylacidiphilales bacterium]|nr:glycosyltransferase [Candidatus Methylacidiphilales bacterium]